MNLQKFLKKKNTHGEIILDFKPRGKAFVFYLTKDTCDKIRTGKCRVEEIAQYKDNLEEFEKYSDDSKCTSLAYSMLKDGFHCNHGSRILLVKFQCGHYSFSNGQHRTCLAAKLDIAIPCEILENERICPACAYENSERLELL